MAMILSERELMSRLFEEPVICFVGERRRSNLFVVSRASHSHMRDVAWLLSPKFEQLAVVFGGYSLLILLLLFLLLIDFFDWKMPSSNSSLILPLVLWDHVAPECHISSMAIDENEKLIFTGTTSGHIIMWEFDIDEVGSRLAGGRLPCLNRNTVLNLTCLLHP